MLPLIYFLKLPGKKNNNNKHMINFLGLLFCFNLLRERLIKQLEERGRGGIRFIFLTQEITNSIDF